MPEPIITRRAQPRQTLSIRDAIGGGLARDDVVGMAHGKPFHVDAPAPCVLEAFDAVRSEYEIEVEGTRPELHEVFTALDFFRFGVGEREGQLAQGRDGGAPISWRLCEEDIRVLRRVGISEKDRARFSDEEIADAAACECVANLEGLAVFKRGHNRATRAACARPTRGSGPSWRTWGRRAGRDRVWGRG